MIFLFGSFSSADSYNLWFNVIFKIKIKLHDQMFWKLNILSFINLYKMVKDNLTYSSEANLNRTRIKQITELKEKS